MDSLIFSNIYSQWKFHIALFPQSTKLWPAPTIYEHFLSKAQAAVSINRKAD
jgi:hypothetical protein